MKTLVLKAELLETSILQIIDFYSSLLISV